MMCTCVTTGLKKLNLNVKKKQKTLIWKKMKLKSFLHKIIQIQNLSKVGKNPKQAQSSKQNRMTKCKTNNTSPVQKTWTEFPNAQLPWETCTGWREKWTIHTQGNGEQLNTITMKKLIRQGWNGCVSVHSLHPSKHVSCVEKRVLWGTRLPREDKPKPKFYLKFQYLNLCCVFAIRCRLF